MGKARSNPTQRCQVSMGTRQCHLVKRHPGFGHVFKHTTERGFTTLFLDEPWPVDEKKPNWTNAPYPYFQS